MSLDHVRQRPDPAAHQRWLNLDERSRSRLLAHVHLPADARSSTLDRQPDPEARRRVAAYLDMIEDMGRRGIGLVLSGPYGGGKTCLAGVIARAYVEWGCEVAYVESPRLASALARPRSIRRGDEWLEDLAERVDALVIDDLSASRDADWGPVEQVVRARIAQRVPTIVTTNRRRANHRDHPDDGRPGLWPGWLQSLVVRGQMVDVPCLVVISDEVIL